MSSKTENNDRSRAGRGRAPLDVRADGDLPASLTIDVTLPEQIHSTPDDERAVAIEEDSVQAGSLLEKPVATTSISLIPVMPPPAETVEQETREAKRRLGVVVSDEPELASMLTSDRLLEYRGRKKPRPEGFWQELVYSSTLRMVNLGDSARVRERKSLDARIGKRLDGGTRFVPVLTRKGGVGKTTVTSLLGMAMADVRDDRVIAIDGNPDRGTLAERVSKHARYTVRDVVNNASSIATVSDFAEFVSRDDTRLDILASDTDPELSQAFDDRDYNVVADLAARFYSIVLTDCGTGIVHSVMRATLERADSVVIVSGGSVDEARLASETLTWLEANGYGALVSNAVVALNTATQGTNFVKIDEIEAHFRSRVRDVVRIPYDPMLAAGSVIEYAGLQPLTRASARELAALVADGLPSSRDAQ